MPTLTLQASFSNSGDGMSANLGRGAKHRPHDSSGRDSKLDISPTERKQVELFQPIERGTPGEVSDKAIATRTPEETSAAKQRTQYYSEVFAIREPPVRELTNSPRDRLKRTSVVTAEVKTNIIVHEEFDFLSHLTAYLAAMYDRPLSSVMVTLDHTACMLFGGNCEPSYMLTISAIPSLTTLTMNKYSAQHVQAFLDAELSCPAERGIVRFLTIPEDNLAVNGQTVFHRIEEMKRNSSPRSNIPSFSRQSTLAKHKPASLQQLSPRSPQASIPTPPQSPHENSTPTPRSDSPRETSSMNRSKTLTTPKIKKKSSSLDTSSIPIPDMPPTRSPSDVRSGKVPKVGKRKSLLQMIANPGRGKAGMEAG